jgi:probable phosphoglycerate mutase
MRVCLIRHGSTSWNEAGRIQGRTDVPLSALGQAQVRSWRIPATFVGAACLASPLVRAGKTARLLGLDAQQDERLAEMDWGRFEGRTLDELRKELGQEMRELEGAGLDFRPPGGESPRQVTAHLAICLQDVAATGRDHVLVTHKGVLRASLVLAFGWDMLGKPPVRCAPGRALVHELDGDGRPWFVAAPDLGAPP